MSDRKKIKLENELKFVTELYNKLKKAKKDTDEYNIHISELLKILKNANKEIVCLAIKSLIELIRINMKVSILNEDELDILFSSLHDIILDQAKSKSKILDPFDLNLFIMLKLPFHIRSNDLIFKFFKLLNTDLKNGWKEQIKNIIVMFINEIKITREMMGIILNHDELMKNLEIKEYLMDLINELSENDYCKLFLRNPALKNLPFRIIKGRHKYEVIREYLSDYDEEKTNFILDHYSNDNDKRIRILLAEKCKVGIELINDNDSEVRLKAIKNLNWNKSTLDSVDRLLDKSLDIRNEMFRIYKEGYKAIKNYLKSYNFDGKSKLKGKKIFKLISMFDNEKDPFDPLCNLIQVTNERKDNQKIEELESEIEDSAETPLDSASNMFSDIVKFESFVYKIFEGCLTAVSSEFIDLIDKSRFSLFFLMKNKENPGFNSYLNHLSVNYKSFSVLDQEIKIIINKFNEYFRGEFSFLESSYMNLENELREFCLESLFNGILNSTEITQFISMETEHVLKSIKDPETLILFEDLLIQKALKSTNLNFVEESANLLKDKLKGMKPFDNYNIQNLYLLNSHTQFSKSDLNLIVEPDILYFYLYYLIHRRSDYLNMELSNDSLKIDYLIEKLFNDMNDTNKVIKLILYYNQPNILDNFVDQILNHKMNTALQKMLLKKKTVLSSLIYFLSTGLISIKSPSFFIKAVKLGIRCNYRDLIRQRFVSYMKLVSQDAFDMFYSICSSLKQYSLNNPNKSLILNPKFGNSDPDHNLLLQNESLASEYSILPSKGKEQSVEDEMLYFICDSVINSREGKIITLNSNFEKYGFYKIADL